MSTEPPATHPLRERLIAADGFGDALSALRADRTLPLVAEWLRDEAGDIEAEHSGEEGERHGPIVEYLRWLADSISPEATP